MGKRDYTDDEEEEDPPLDSGSRHEDYMRGSASGDDYVESDGSSRQDRKRRRDNRGEASRKKRNVGQRRDPDEPSHAESVRRDDVLFEDSQHASKEQVDKRLERAVAAITLDMLESVRLSHKRLSHIMEHPRCDEYLVGAYVRYPDLEIIETGDVPETMHHTISPLPAQITKVQKTNGDDPNAPPYLLTLIQYTQRSDGSLKIRKAKMDMKLVYEPPFAVSELEKWRVLLKLFSGRAGAEKLQSLPQILPVKAAKLNSFTFTSEDVDEILRRKREDRAAAGGPSNASVATLNIRDLYLKKAELEYLVSDLKSLLNDTSPDDEQFAATEKKLSETEAEYSTVMQQVDLLKKEDEERKLGRTKEGASDVTSNSTAALRKWSKRVNADKSTMLTPRFLQTKGVDSKLASAVQTWQSLEWVRTPTKLSWKIPATIFDVLYSKQECKSKAAWKPFQRALYAHSRQPEFVAELKNLLSCEKVEGSCQLRIEYKRPKMPFEELPHRETEMQPLQAWLVKGEAGNEEMETEG